MMSKSRRAGSSQRRVLEGSGALRVPSRTAKDPYLARRHGGVTPPKVVIDGDGKTSLVFQNEVDHRRFGEHTEALIAHAKQNLPKWINELDALLDRVDPVELYRRMAVVDRWRRFTSSGDSYYGSDAALQQLLARVVAKPVREGAAMPSHQDVSWCDQLLRAIMNGQQHALLDEANPGVGRSDLARGLMLSEYLHDRMNGYRQHLRSAYRKILAPVRDVTVREAGFDPLLMFDVVSAYQRIVDARQAPILDRMLGAVPPPIADAAGRQAFIERFTVGFIEAMAPPAEDIACLVAAALDVPVEQVAPVIRTLTTPVGSVGSPDPAVNNDVLWRPIVGLDDSRGIWVQPDDSLDETLRWYDRAIDAVPTLRGRFDKAKQSGAETVARTVLASVFPPDRVHANVFFGTPQSGEADIVVTLPGVTVIVEVKGHRLTE